jgi:hypothetical protein
MYSIDAWINQDFSKLRVFFLAINKTGGRGWLRNTAQKEKK